MKFRGLASVRLPDGEKRMRIADLPVSRDQRNAFHQSSSSDDSICRVPRISRRKGKRSQGNSSAYWQDNKSAFYLRQGRFDADREADVLSVENPGQFKERDV